MALALIRPAKQSAIHRHSSVSGGQILNRTRIGGAV